MAENKTARVNIVVAAEFRDDGDQAVLEGLYLSGVIPDAALHFVHVVPARADIRDAKKLAEINDAMEKSSAKLVETVKGHCAGLPTHDREIDMHFHVRIGDIAEAIHQLAVDVSADLVVVGTRGHSKVEQLWKGSVADALVRKAHVPVVVAHPKDYSGMERSERPEPPRPEGAVEGPHGISTHERVRFGGSRSSHVPGLI